MRHYLVLGETGAGKTSLTKILISSFDRVLVLDRNWEYGAAERLEVVQGLEAFCARIQAGPREAWRIAFRTDQDVEWGAAVVLVYHLQKTLKRAGEKVPSLCIVAEEIGLFSSPHKLPQWLGNLWNYGRHYGITGIGICRQDTETHSVLRLNSTLIFFRCSEITSKVAKGMSGERIERIATLPLYDEEARKTYPRKPVVNVHYLTFPVEAGDVVERVCGRARPTINITVPTMETTP